MGRVAAEGALGIAVGDRILMHEFAIYSVIPPEGCAAILWRDSGRKVEAATALKLTAPEPAARRAHRRDRAGARGGAHTNHEQAATLLDLALSKALASVSAMPAPARLDARYAKWRAMGNSQPDRGVIA
jgi:acetyl-CoA carboxylase carboxyl transferase subunit alpha